MNKRQNLQKRIATPPIDHDYIYEDLRHVIVIEEGIKKTEDILIKHAVEIVTPQPYSVFALCKTYEYSQRN